MAALDVREFKESLRRAVDEYVKLAVTAAEALQAEGGETTQATLVTLEDEDDEVKSNDGDNDSDNEDEDEAEALPLTARERHLAVLDSVTESVSSVFSTLLADFKHQRNSYSILEHITDEILLADIPLRGGGRAREE